MHTERLKELLADTPMEVLKLLYERTAEASRYYGVHDHKLSLDRLHECRAIECAIANASFEPDVVAVVDRYFAPSFVVARCTGRYQHPRLCACPPAPRVHRFMMVEPGGAA